MVCKGNCKKIGITGIALRDWNDDPDLRRCSTCGVIIHRDNWLITKIGRTVCPCCKLQLKANSRGKRAREKRQQKFLNKVEAN